jgi:hypothetical protein
MLTKTIFTTVLYDTEVPIYVVLSIDWHLVVYLPDAKGEMR